MGSLRDRLAAGDIVLIDGATGTELERLGVPMREGAWCGDVVRTHPDVLRAVHEAHIAAGAELIITNTFAAHRHLLAFGGIEQHFELLNRRSVEVALEARDRAGNPDVAVAASMSTSRQGGTPPPLAVARDNFAEQAEILAAAGADLFVLEMMRDLDETQLCIDAAAATGLPIWLGWSRRGPPMLVCAVVTWLGPWGSPSHRWLARRGPSCRSTSSRCRSMTERPWRQPTSCSEPEVGSESQS